MFLSVRLSWSKFHKRKQIKYEMIQLPYLIQIISKGILCIIKIVPSQNHDHRKVSMSVTIVLKNTYIKLN